MPQLDYGAVPDWLTALVSALALIFAARAAVITGRLLTVEQGRDRQRAQELVGEQARKVTAWWGATGEAEGVFLRNASDAAVYKGTIMVGDNGDRDFFELAAIGTIPPSESPIFRSCESLGWAPATQVGDVRLEFAFTDAQSAHWLRNADGQLAQITDQLVIWADENRRRSLEQFAISFLSTHQVKVVVNSGSLEGLHWQMESSRTDQPDIFITSHDRLAALVEADLISPVDLPEGRRSLFEASTLEAATYKGKLYAIPYAMDTVALYTNLELVKEEPESLEQLVTYGKYLVSRGLVKSPLALPMAPYGEAFIAYPLFVSALGAKELLPAPTGGKKGAAGGLDFTSPSSIAGLEKLRNFIAEAGLDTSLTRQAARQMFIRGETPFLISTGTTLRDIELSGMRARVSSVPAFQDEAPAHAVTLIQLFVVGSGGSNPALARSLLLDQMTRPAVIQQLTADQQHLPALSTVLQNRLGANSLLRALHEQCERGLVLPSHSAYPEVWDALNELELTIVNTARPSIKASARRVQALLDRMGG